MIADRYGFSARISDFWTYLKLALGIDDFKTLDFRDIENDKFLSYLINNQIDWQNGKDIDLTEIKKAILTVSGDGLQSLEKIMIDSDTTEDIIWAIYLAICDPTKNL